jgi:hypothetical protein
MFVHILEGGWHLAAVGLFAKVLGPIGLAHLIWTEQWPIAILILCATIDRCLSRSARTITYLQKQSPRV